MCAFFFLLKKSDYPFIWSFSLITTLLCGLTKYITLNQMQNGISYLLDSIMDHIPFDLGWWKDCKYGASHDAHCYSWASYSSLSANTPEKCGFGCEWSENEYQCWCMLVSESEHKCEHATGKQRFGVKLMWIVLAMWAKNDGKSETGRPCPVLLWWTN